MMASTKEDAMIHLDTLMLQFEAWQSVIDSTATILHGLKVQCATTEEITQHEIKENESKLIKLFGKQLIAKSKLANSSNQYVANFTEYPKTQQWLHIVGIPDNVVKGLLGGNVSLESLLKMSEAEVLSLLKKYGCHKEGIDRLNIALSKLRRCTDVLSQSEKALGNNNIDFHWSNYKSSSASSTPFAGNSPKIGRPSTSSLPAETVANSRSVSPTRSKTPPSSVSSSRFTPPQTPNVRPAATKEKKFPTTPPPSRRMRLQPEGFPLIKSRSHESQLGQRVDVGDAKSNKNKKKPNNLTLAGSMEAVHHMRRQSADSSDTNSSRGVSPVKSPPVRSPGVRLEDRMALPDNHPHHVSNANPRSPKTPIGLNQPSMLHSIKHKFASTLTVGMCDYCQKHMFYGYRCRECKFTSKFVMGSCDICRKHVLKGKVCKYCKFKCHKDCASKAAPACGLPEEYVTAFINSLGYSGGGSPSLPGSGEGHPRAGSAPIFNHPPGSSSSTSSCTSSTPSSPAPYSMSGIPSSSPAPSPHIQVQTFTFPEIPGGGSPEVKESKPIIDGEDVSDFVNTNTSNDSDQTVVDSNSSERTLPDRGDSVDSQDVDMLDNLHWRRQPSLSIQLKEWEIPFDQVIMEEAIGTGRYGTVYKGSWHGDVALKMINFPDTDNQPQLAAFKLEIAMLTKTRHENLVLFMGACMKPPHLGIVTSLCKGQTLYSLIHVRREKLARGKMVIIASNIAQGMGYLHAKGIVHKDLKTKNIFIENGKCVITDFGLFSFTKLCHGDRRGDWITIPPGWLCYLSPQVMRALQVGKQDDDLPFTKESDVYAFGTVWYELLCGERPYKNQPAESVIWQVGKGMKQSLATMQASRDVKDILMSCWSFKQKDRPTFAGLLKTLERLPKKWLLRSPSHPVHLSRSAESIF